MFSVLFIYASAASVGGFFIPTDRIVGGYPITIEQRPFQVAIVLYDDIICGGSIIKEDVILTAAHCLMDVPENQLQVRVGATLRESGGTLVAVRKIMYHEDYNDATLGLDVGLIWLQKTLHLNDKVKMIALPRQGETFADGSTAVVSGWGLLQYGGDLPDVLQELQIPLVNRDVCNIEYRGMINQDMICAGVDEGGKDACQMDSGGPLTAGHKQVGIVSFGYDCAMPHFAGIYTNVANFRDWIDTKIAENRLFIRRYAFTFKNTE